MTWRNPLAVPAEAAPGHPLVESTSMSRRAFTVVEMLVVISLVTLLISLLLPAVSKSRDSASRTQCASNLKQCSTALQSYATEHGGILLCDPNVTGRDAGRIYRDGGAFDLRTVMRAYVGDFRVWGCPTLGLPPVDDAAANPGPLIWSTYMYWAIDTDGRPDFGAGKPVPQRMDESGSSRPLIQDRFDDRRSQGIILGYLANHANRYWTDGWGAASGNNSGPIRCIKTREDGQGANISFFDGSTRWVPEPPLEDVGNDYDFGWPVLSVRVR